MTETRVSSIGVASLAAFTGVITWGWAMLFGWPLIFLEAVIPGGGIASYLFVVLGGLIGGLIVGTVAALIYNFAALFMGGIVLELEASSESG